MCMTEREREGETKASIRADERGEADFSKVGEKGDRLLIRFIRFIRSSF